MRTFIDLFCGIGGFHVAAERLGMECVFACDIDAEARRAYAKNFGVVPNGDITQICEKTVPDHDLLCAGFPCQPFSIIGSSQGFADPRGTLFFDILRIVREKQPKVVLLENVKRLFTINNGEVLTSIKQSLQKAGYTVHHKILNALDFGLPQKRERAIIIAFRDNIETFEWPTARARMRPLSDILEGKPNTKHFASDKIISARQSKHKASTRPAIWHENKSGNISSHPYSCALRAGASYNYLLVDGERRLTPREMLRLQGFPDSFTIVCSDSQTRKQTGNAVPIPMIQAVMDNICHEFR